MHLVTFMDIFSRFTKISPLFETTSEAIIECFGEKWISVFGLPKFLLTDNGSQYISTKMADFCKTNKISQKFTSSYNPTCNSISERLNQEIGVVLRINNGYPLETLIEKIENKLNKTVNRTIEETPFTIMFSYAELDPNGKVEPLELDPIRERIIRKGQKEQDRRNVGRKNTEEFTINKKVLIRNRKLGKLETPWLGPYKIEQTSNNPNQVIVNMGYCHKKKTSRILNVFK